MPSPARLPAGIRIGPYRLEAFIGEGAMGRVYRATDSRLGRPVALKLLPEDLLHNPEHLSRLEQEAKAASALNHPNIVTVYEVGEQIVSPSGGFPIGDAESGGSPRLVPFLAMEFIEGKSLRQILGSGPLSVRKVLDLGVQASEALSRAHESGIIHRDLKPDNIMVRSDGYLKILDFGLARMMAPGENASGARTYDAGYFVVGTASYMSPEQARGRVVDGRSDVFALGIIFYEALAGRSPFPGGSAVDVLSAILNKEPDPLSELAPKTPRDLARVVERCLAKDPDERFQSMRDLSLELKAIRRDIDSGLISAGARWSGSVPVARARNPLLRASIGAAALLVAALGFFVWKWKSSTAPARVIRVTSTGRAFSPAISPDGTLVAYVEEGQPRHLCVRQIGSDAVLSIDTGGLLPSDPAFSSDGKSIYFSANSLDTGASIFRSATFGGPPQRLGPGFRPRLSPDGRRLAFLRHRAGERPSIDLCTATADGDRPDCVPAGPEPDELFHFTWDPGSSALTVSRGVPIDTTTDFGVYRPDERRMEFGGTFGRVNLLVNDMAHDPSSRAVYLSGSQIYGRGGDLQRLEGAGLSPVTSGVADYRGLSIDASSRTAVTADFRENSNIFLLPLSGDPAKDSASPHMLTSDNEGDYRPVWSPDGRQIAFISTRTRHRSLWVMNADGAAARELTPDTADYGWPSWSPDGKLIAFACNRTGNHEIYVVELANGTPRQLTHSRVFNGQSWWTPDGAWLYYESSDARGDPILKRIRATGGDPETVLDADFEYPSVSPDGEYLATTSSPQLGEEIPLKIIRTADRRVVFETRISREGHLVTWLPDSRSVAAVRVDPETGGVNVFAVPIDGAAARRLTRLPATWRISTASIDASGRNLLVVRYRNNSDIVAIGPLRGPTLSEFLGLAPRR